jgi:hypothetical protein
LLAWVIVMPPAYDTARGSTSVGRTTNERFIIYA